MRQTTSGEIHKTEILDKDSVENFLKQSRSLFESKSIEENCIYGNLRQNNDKIVNYLNVIKSDKNDPGTDQLKNILRKEFDDCEKVYPYLGDAFLHLFFESKILNSKSIKILRKNSYKKFLNTIPESNAKNITSWIVENSSPDREIDIQESYIDNIKIRTRDKTFFKLDYDCDFLGSKKSINIKHYRFAIIDGFIETLGEIHHLLHYAAENKEPHVIFCFGMSDEVKRVIIENNTRGITQIIPISFSLCEDTVNILNDIAILHKSEVISSSKGQTISQEMRKQLSVGKEMTINRKGFSIEPLASDFDIKSHVRYLQEKINNSEPDINTDVIKNRVKNIKSKSLTVYINKNLSKDTKFSRSLDYGLRMLKNSKQPYYLVSLDNKEIMMPVKIYDYLEKKVNTTKELIYNIERLVLIA